jgi:hypothetical protein
MRTYQIRVELDERFEPEDVRLDLRTNELHPLHKHNLDVAVSHCGGAMLILNPTAVDLWTAILTTMHLFGTAATYRPQLRPPPGLGFPTLLMSRNEV